jgi:hypothetical protein
MNTTAANSPYLDYTRAEAYITLHHVEAVDDDHVALIIRPGVAGRIAGQELLNKKGTA